MNELSRQFFKACKNVRILSDETNIIWEDIQKEVSDLPRGWFELSQLPSNDRISFMRDHWAQRLTYYPDCHSKLSDFFSHLDDIGVVLSAQREGDPLEAELIYSLYDNRSFFRGLPPVNEKDIAECQEELHVTFPGDYLSFFKIHNGFGKLSSLGLFPCEYIAEMKQRLISLLMEAHTPLTSGEKNVDIGSLIPFYEEEGLLSFQCFYTDWYPLSEMGNVYLSGIDYTVSDTGDRKGWRENLAFPTFLEWFCEYLEGMNISP